MLASLLWSWQKPPQPLSVWPQQPQEAPRAYVWSYGPDTPPAWRYVVTAPQAAQSVSAWLLPPLELATDQPSKEAIVAPQQPQNVLSWLLQPQRLATDNPWRSFVGQPQAPAQTASWLLQPAEPPVVVVADNPWRYLVAQGQAPLGVGSWLNGPPPAAVTVTADNPWRYLVVPAQEPARAEVSRLWITKTPAGLPASVTGPGVFGGRVLWQPKALSETRNYNFDATNVFSAGQTIVSIMTSASLYSGFDPSPSAILSGTPSVSGTNIVQQITGGAVGAVYDVECSIVIGAGMVLTQRAFLAVVEDLN